MNIQEEIKGTQLDVRVATKLAVAFAMLEMAPYTRFLDGSADEMAMYVVKHAKEQGNLGKVADALGVTK